MSYAPANLSELMAYLGEQGVANLGIVGGPRHTYGYHLGRDRIFSADGQGNSDYSIQSARDKAGLSDAASAVDLGRVNGEIAGLRPLTAWLWEECQAEAPDTRAIREVLGSADGQTVRCWVAREAGGPVILDDCADASHLWHTHISFFRDSQGQDHRSLFGRYFEGGDTMKLLGTPVTPLQNKKVMVKAGTTFVKDPARADVGANDNSIQLAGQHGFPADNVFVPDWKVLGTEVGGKTAYYHGMDPAWSTYEYGYIPEVGLIPYPDGSLTAPIETTGGEYTQEDLDQAVEAAVLARDGEWEAHVATTLHPK